MLAMIRRRLGLMKEDWVQLSDSRALFMETVSIYVSFQIFSRILFRFGG